MARRSYAGAAAALTLSSGINATDLTITTTGTATGWPTGAGGKFLVVIARGTAAEEKAYVTSRSSNVLTVASTGDRGVDGTGAATHAAGVAIEHCIGAVDVDEANAHVATTTQDDHTQYLRTDGTRAFSAVTAIANSTPTTSAVGDAAAIGTGNVLARSTHVHGREAFATPVATGTANAAGSAATVPHSDHVHLGPGTLGYAEVTANQTGISTGPFTDLTGLSKAVTVVSGRRIRVTASFLAQNNGAGNYITAAIREGSTTLKTHPQVITYANQDIGWEFSVVLTPTAGSHTYKLSLSGGSGSTQLSASSTDPASILVEDIGV